MRRKEWKETAKKTSAFAMIFLLAMLFPVFKINTAKAEARSDLNITFYADPDTAWAALVADNIDFMQWSLTREQKEAAEADPNIQICKYDELGMVEFDINNNYTILTYPGIRSATNHPNVRKAIACLIDKNYIISDILFYYGVRIDLPIAATQASWMNTSAIYPNYDYEYNPEAAASYLAAAGFTDTDSNGWLNFPSDWDGAPGIDSSEMPLVVCIRSDHGDRLAVGQYLIAQLEVTLAATSIGAGFKTTGTTWQQPRPVLSPKVMGNRDYQVYTGSWSVGRYPTYLFWLFHSMFWGPYGSNYITGVDKYGNPNYPDIDEAVETIWYTPDIPSAMDATWRFGGRHEKHCITIPLWSYSSYMAYRKELISVTNMNGYGLENDYTFLNAYRVGGGPIRFGTVSGPSRLNILYSSWHHEYAFLDRVYAHGMSMQPYNLAVDQPWVLQDWEVGTWVDLQDGYEKTVVTYYIRKDAGIVAPVTGTYLRNWDAHDFEFTVWYNYAFTDSWQWGSFMDVKYTRITDVNSDGWDEFQVYFDDQSYWFYTAPTYPLLTKDELIDPLCATTVESWAQTGTTEYYLANNVVQVLSATLNGSPIYEGVDFIIKAGYALFSHIEFYPLRDLTGTISITYYYADIPATGFYLAGLPWQQTMYSLGTHYPVAMTSDPPGIGDTIVLNKNMNFFLERPPLGEIDWSWYWVGIVKPRSGYYEININDLVRLTGSVDHRGDGQYDPLFLPAADLVIPCCLVDRLFDMLTFLYHWGSRFGQPPSSLSQVELQNQPKKTVDFDASKSIVIASSPTVFIEPQTRIVGQNLTCTLKIKIANVESTNKLHGYELKIYYNKTLLDPVSATQGTFLNSTASTNFSAYLNDSYNATHGQIWLICLQNVPNSPGVFGDGTLAEITFIAAIDAKGTTAVSIVSNLATVTFLPAANDAVATAISHTATNGLIKVTIRGDVDGDGNVTIFDVVRITRIYNVPSTDPRYDPDADLNNNGLIEIFDVVLCTSNYGKKDP